MIYFYLYLLVINLFAFYAMRSDHKRLKFSRYKITEQTYLMLSLIFGSAGVLVGFYRYKSIIQKKTTSFLIHVLPVLQAVLIIIIEIQI